MTSLLHPRAKGNLTSGTRCPTGRRSPTSRLLCYGHSSRVSNYEAWTAVTSILITIVTLGIMIGIGAVLLTL